MSVEPPVLVERRGHVGLVALNRPQSRNALSGELLSALQAAAADLGADPRVRCAVFTGAGRTFAAGADLRELKARSIEDNLAYNATIIEAFDAVARLPMPTIAAMNGHALGGGLELALACTMRVASADARLGLPEVRLGILPAAGGTSRLPRLVGAGHAWRLLLTGQAVDGTRALEIGLVDEVAPADEVMSRALALAEQIAEPAPLAVRAVVRAVEAGADLGVSEGITCACEQLPTLLASADHQEGLAAFAERRSPRFDGK